MVDRVQLVAQIRFAIERLSERNAQHEWEHLCRHLVRARICSNILPATGPVQAGGDQGRDFETFRTFLSRSHLKDRSFVGLISEKPLAFACTLQDKKSIASKVRHDVKTIMSSGSSVEGVYILCSCDVVVAKRHALQLWARETFNIRLEVLDGTAIAEFLEDQEIFWLAERYLQLPSELFPTLSVEEEQDWYSRILNKWQHENRPAQTFADFSEIRSAARDAMGPFAYDMNGRPVIGYERPELPFWIERLDEIAAHGIMASVRRRALYEASVLRLRGLGSLIGQEDRLRLYFAEVPNLDAPGDLEDADVLLTYILTANKLNKTKLDDSEIETWYWALEQRTDARISESKRSNKVNERCALLEVRGHLALFAQYALRELNVSETLKYWSKLAKLAVYAPLFPLERFADRLSQYARYIGTHPDYAPLTEKIDALVAQRFGAFKTAEKCLDRAKAFREAGDLPRAMAQLHKAKIDWFADESLGRSLLALNWLSMSYQEQGLFFASKYYAISGAYVALHANDTRLKPLIARSLEQAAGKDYAVGAWHGFLELAETTAIFYPHFASDIAANFNDPNGELHRLLYHLALLPVITKKTHPNLGSFAQEKVKSVVERLNLGEVLEEVQSVAKAQWEASEIERLQKTLEEQIAGPPWSDSGPMRRTQWKAHGVRWDLDWKNDYETTLAAEEFLAAFQIFLSDLAGYDLCFMRTTVRATIRLSHDVDGNASGLKGFDVHFESSNADRSAIITLPSYQHFRDGDLSRDDLSVGALSVVNTLLSEVSLLPTAAFYNILNERFSQGLQNKLLIGAPYNQCFRAFVPEEIFNSSQRTHHTSATLLSGFTTRLPEALRWYDKPGPGYTPEGAQKQIKNRYEGFALPIGRTLERLIHEPTFQKSVSTLRADGWKDWHLLSAVFHVTMNYRLNNRSIVFPSPEAERAVTYKMTREPEPADAIIIPVEEYSEDQLRKTMPAYMVSCLETYNLEIHQLTPDFGAIDDFLSHRFNFWRDDVEHDDPFTIAL